MKLKLKNIYILFFSLTFFLLILFFSLPVKTIASYTNYDVSKIFTYQKNNINVTGSYPVISNLNNKTFETQINTEILTLIDNLIASKSDAASKKFTLSYKTYLSGNTFSTVLFLKNTATSEVAVGSIVIDIAKSQKLTINSFLGVNGITYANKVVSNQATSLGLKSATVTSNTAFYVENSNIVIIYGAGEVTFAQKGNITISIDPKKITNYTISSSLYYKKSDYNVIMLPVRAPLEALGFKVSWSNSNNTITISNPSGEFLSYLKIGENRYSKGSYVIRSLEFAPESKNGVTYVPISFFSDIAGLLYSIDNSGNIIISKYSL